MRDIRERSLTDYQKRIIREIEKHIDQGIEDDAYNEYLASVRASEFKSDPFNDDYEDRNRHLDQPSNRHLEVTHS